MAPVFLCRSLNDKWLTASIIEIYLKWHDIRALQTENLDGMVLIMFSWVDRLQYRISIWEMPIAMDR